MVWNIKKDAEDFKVTEMPEKDFKSNLENNYLIFRLIKKNYSQIKSIKIISDFFNVNREDIGFSGIKDKYAVTSQYISIDKHKFKNNNFDSINIGFKKEFDSDLMIELVGSSIEKLFPGKLYGNMFEITIRDVKKKDIDYLKKINANEIKIPNYFGEQRFGKNNFEVGRCIVRRDYKKAINLIRNSGIEKNKYIIDKYYKKNNEIEVLKKFPNRFFKLYLHSVQSKIFNDILASKIKGEIVHKKVYSGNLDIEKELPLVGHDTENELALEIMDVYDLMPFDFINKQISLATLHEIKRDSFVKTKISLESYDINKNILTVKFDLTKGSYATEVIETLKNRADS